MGFSRQEYWEWVPFPSSGDLPDPGIESPSPTLRGDSLLSEPPGQPKIFPEREKVPLCRPCACGCDAIWVLVLFCLLLFSTSLWEAQCGSFLWMQGLSLSNPHSTRMSAGTLGINILSSPFTQSALKKALANQWKCSWYHYYMNIICKTFCFLRNLI